MFILAFKSIIFNVCIYSWEIEYWNQRRTPTDDSQWKQPDGLNFWRSKTWLPLHTRASLYNSLKTFLWLGFSMSEIHYQQDRNKSFYPCNLLEKSNLVDIWFQSGRKRNWLQAMTLHTPFCLLGSGVCTFPSEPEDHKIRIFITCDAP